MSVTKTNYALLCGFVLLFTTTGRAQFSSRYSVGFQVGALVYYGDLSPSKFGAYKTPGFVFGLTGLRHYTPVLSARLDLAVGRLAADEAAYATPEFRRYRAFAFSSRITEALLSAEWSPLGRERKLSPYAVAGVGYSGMKVARDYSRFNAAYFVAEPELEKELAADIATTPPKGVAVFPVGVGVKLALNHQLAITTEAAYRYTLTDYADGFSRAGKPGNKDSYAKLSVGLRYAIGAKSPYACPIIRY